MKHTFFLLFFFVGLIACDQKIHIQQVEYLELPHFKIKTPNAEYLFDIEGGGFSSIKDNNGVEWIGFKKGEGKVPQSAGADFRGLPNLVYRGDDNGSGHPGFQNCISKIQGDNQIVTETKSGKWKWQWTFENDGAFLEILKMDTSRAYWFLYEGIPGGTFDPHNQYWGNNMDGYRDDTPPLNPELLAHGNWQWAFFGHKYVDNTFFVIQINEDAITDNFSYMGASREGIDSDDGMVVFGFGRHWGDPLFRQPEKFFIGFYQSKALDKSSFVLLKKNIEIIINKYSQN
jgi:hypothetical protein